MIAAVGHVAFQVTDVEASVSHATQVLGMREIGRREGTVFLSHGPCQHSLEYKEGRETALDHGAAGQGPRRLGRACSPAGG